jgi:hypothetical protein
MAKVTRKSKDLWDALTLTEKKAVKQRILRHVRACWRNGIDAENFERVLIEAIEVEQMEQRAGNTETADSNRSTDGWPLTRYTVYLQPVDCFVR